MDDSLVSYFCPERSAHSRSQLFNYGSFVIGFRLQMLMHYLSSYFQLQFETK